MLSNTIRANVIQGWFAVLALVVVGALAFGAQVRLGTGGLLVTLSLVPPLIVFMLWPRAEPLTAGDVLRGTDRRT